MKRLLVFIALIASVIGYSQSASKVNNSQNVYAAGQPRVVLSCDTLLSGLFRLYPKDQVTWKFSQLTNKPTTLGGYGITDAVATVDFTWTNLAGKPTFATVATSGSYLDLTNQPTIPTNNNQLSNGSGYITASSADVLTNKSGNISQWTNNAGYLTGITSGQVTTALGYTPPNPNGTNLQYIAGDGSKITFPAIGSGTVTSVGITSTDFSISGSPVTTSGSITANLNTSGVAAGSYRNVTVTNKGIVTAGINPTFNSAVGRSLNSNYTISTTLNARVSYTIRIAYNITILVGSTGVATLQYSTNGGSSWVTVSTVSNSLNLGLALTGYNDFVLSGEIPANALVRVTTTGTVNATVTFPNATEVTY